MVKVHRGKVHKRWSNLQSKNIYKIFFFFFKFKKIKKTNKNLAAEKSGGTTDRVTADQRYNGARCTEAWLYVNRNHYLMCKAVNLTHTPEVRLVSVSKRSTRPKICNHKHICLFANILCWYLDRQLDFSLIFYTKFTHLLFPVLIEHALSS